MESRLPGRPYLTYGLTLLCTLALVRLALLPDPRAARVLNALGVVPARFLAAPFSPAQLVTIFSSVFLHAGWVHLAGNALYLVVFGPAVELRLGRLRYLTLFTIAGAGGALLHVAMNPTSSVPLVGASGAIAGVLGAHLVLHPRGKVTTLIPVIVFVEVASLPAAFVIALWFALQVASALAPVAGTGAAASVGWYAHIGGFALGALLAAFSPAAKPGRKARRSKASARTRTAAGSAETR